MIPPDGKGLQLLFGLHRLRKTEYIWKMKMYGVLFSENTFGSIPISVVTHLKSKPEPQQCRPEVVSGIDPNRRLSERHNLSKSL